VLGGDGEGEERRRELNGVEDMGEEKGLVVNVQELFFRFTLDVTTDFLLGSDVKSLT